MKDMLKRGGILDVWKGFAKDRLGLRKLINNIPLKIDNERKEENRKGRRGT